MEGPPVPNIPEPRLRMVRNETGLSHFQCDKMGPGRRFHDTVVVKGAFALTPGVLTALEEPAPIHLADTYWPEAPAARSSVRDAGDALLTKPGTDVFVTGTARAPGGAAARLWEVAVVVRSGATTVLGHELYATGPRRFEHSALRGWRVSDPEPAREVPIRYELAYGGAYYDPRTREGRVIGWVTHEPNPCGVGFFNPDALDTKETYRAPQWELASDPVTTPDRAPALAGLGPVARHWSARTRFVGACDAAWEARMREDLFERRLPYDYAEDFDLRFFQCAHPALASATHLRGDEQIGLRGLLAQRSDFFTRLPGTSVRARVLAKGEDWRTVVLPLDTVHVDLDLERVYLCWRLSLDQARGVSDAILYLEDEGGAP